MGGLMGWNGSELIFCALKVSKWPFFNKTDIRFTRFSPKILLVQLHCSVSCWLFEFLDAYFDRCLEVLKNVWRSQICKKSFNWNKNKVLPAASKTPEPIIHIPFSHYIFIHTTITFSSTSQVYKLLNSFYFNWKVEKYVQNNNRLYFLKSETWKTHSKWFRNDINKFEAVFSSDGSVKWIIKNGTEIIRFFETI